MLESRLWRTVAWAGRLLLLGAVAFCWGGFVAPQLVSLAFPRLLPPDALPRGLDPGIEGTAANAISAAALLIVSLLAFANAIIWCRGRDRWGIVGGWAALAVAAAYLAWDELKTDLHGEATDVLRRAVFGESLDAFIWAVHLSLLPAALGLVAWSFTLKGRRGRAVGVPLSLGLAAWMLATALDMSQLNLFAGRADVLEIVLDESLEFSGSLLIALSAGIAVRWDAIPQQQRSLSSGHHLRVLAVGSIAVVALLGSIAVGFVFRAPIVNAQAHTHTNAFHLSLKDREAVTQELRMPAAPLGRLKLRMATHDPNARSGTAGVRVTRLGTSEPVLAEGSVEVPVGNSPEWIDVELYPQLAEPDGQQLALWVVANVDQDTELWIGATKLNRYLDGRLWVNGKLTWSDQDLEFVAYGARDLTLSKLAGLLSVLTSDWRWPLLLVDLCIALTFITFIPALLVTAALPQRDESN